MQNQKLLLLTEKFLLHNLSESEQEELEFLLQDPSHLSSFKKMISDSYLLATEGTTFNEKTSFEEIKRSLQPKLRKVHFSRYFLKYAAVLVVLITSVFLIRHQLGEKMATNEDVVLQHITLELEDGSTKKLSMIENDTVQRGNGIVGLLNNGTLDYSVAEKDVKVHFNTIKVPYGRRFKVILSDGTLVHLNSGSQLTYPIPFEKNQRKIQLTGEAFLEVAKDVERPFTVATTLQDIQVLGTIFNVSAYSDDHQTTTTLIEGSVSVRLTSEQNISTILAPNEQVVVVRNEKRFLKRTVNTNQFTNWVDGVLVFKDAPFTEIAKKLERFYGVQLICNNEALKNQKFNARFDTETIFQVMDIFKTDQGIEYTLSNNIITIN